MPIPNGTFDGPVIASDGIQEIAVTDDSKRWVVVACNFSPVVREAWRIGLPKAGKWREALKMARAPHFETGVTRPWLPNLTVETARRRLRPRRPLGAAAFARNRTTSGDRIFSRQDSPVVFD